MNEYSGQFGLAFIFQSTYEFIDFLDKMNKLILLEHSCKRKLIDAF